MFRTAILYSQKRALALSVHFKHPDLGMKDYEILSRASAFLLHVDPPKPADPTGKYAHLEISRAKQKAKLLKQDYAPDPAGGPPRRVQDLGWLEFAPGDYRPLVHCVAASHVLAPWKWKKYYPLDWLQVVTQEHCVYSLEVYDPETAESLAKFALNPYAIHHPQEMDLAIIHFKQEDATLRHLRNLGVEIMYLRDKEKEFENGEEVTFEGFAIVGEEPIFDRESEGKDKKEDKKDSNDDTRVFVPYTETGTLIAATNDRFLAKTAEPLVEGLCGGPVIDTHGTIAGVIEGIVPTDHKDERVAGAASFIPSFRIQEFLNYAERIILKTVVPAELFSNIVELKNTGELGNVNMNPDHCATEFERHVELLRKHHSKEEVEAILRTIKREKEEVMDIMTTEGGQLDDVIARVRTNTIMKQKAQVEMLMAMQKEKAEKTAAEGSAANSDESGNTSPTTIVPEFTQQSDAFTNDSSPKLNKEMADAEYEEKPSKDEITTKS